MLAKQFLQSVREHISSNHRTRAAKRRLGTARRRLSLKNLEDRRVLASLAGLAPTEVGMGPALLSHSIYMHSGQVAIFGTAHDDHASVSAIGDGKVLIELNGDFRTVQRCGRSVRQTVYEAPKWRSATAVYSRQRAGS